MSEYTVLPTNLVDDELAPSNERRRYRMIDNGDGTHSFEEVTTYTTVGSNYGASQINAQNEVINQLSEDLNEIKERGMMPNLDYSNPLHTFDNSHLTYTASTKCYLVGSLQNTNNSAVTISVNGTDLYSVNSASGYVGFSAIPITPINSGDIVSVTTMGANTKLCILKELMS